MNNYKAVTKPESRVLSEMLQAEIGDQERSVFVESFLKNTIKILTENPSQYLSYGPYWWAIKALMIRSGHTAFGTVVQKEWMESLSYEEPALTIVACWAYSQQRIDDGNIYGYNHYMPTEDGEGFEYLLGDDEFALLYETKAIFA